MEIARLVVDLLKAAAWPITLLSIILVFRSPIRSALEQRNVRFEALGMNVEITRQAEAAADALESSSATEMVNQEPGNDRSDVLPRDRLGAAGRRALEGFPDAPHIHILMSAPAHGLLNRWNEINRSLRTVQDSFELGWRSNWGSLMSRATGNQNWAELGLSWSRVKGAMSLFAEPIGSNVGPWQLSEVSPPVADEVARLLMDSMRVLYDRLLSEVQRLSAIDIVPGEILDAEHGPPAPLDAQH